MGPPGASPQISPPLVLGGCKAPDRLVLPDKADWRRKLTPAFSTRESNQHQAVAPKKMNPRSEQKPHNGVDNCK